MSERTWTKLGALAAALVLFVVAFSGGFATYAAFSDTETAGVSFAAAGNIAPAPPNNAAAPGPMGAFDAGNGSEDTTPTTATPTPTETTTTAATTTEPTTTTTTTSTPQPTTTTTTTTKTTTPQPTTTTTTTTTTTDAPDQCDGSANTGSGDGEGTCGQQSIGGSNLVTVATVPPRQ